MGDIVFKFTAQDRPVISPVYVFRWEETEDSFVLLHAEGIIIKLNESAGEILRRCDGNHSVAQLVEEMKALYPEAASEVETIIHLFLELAYAKGWIQHEA